MKTEVRKYKMESYVRILLKHRNQMSLIEGEI